MGFFEISDARCVSIGDGAVALVYRAKAQRASDEPFEALVTSAQKLQWGEIGANIMTECEFTGAGEGSLERTGVTLIGMGTP